GLLPHFSIDAHQSLLDQRQRARARNAIALRHTGIQPHFAPSLSSSTPSAAPSTPSTIKQSATLNTANETNNGSIKSTTKPHASRSNRLEAPPATTAHRHSWAAQGIRGR